MSVPSSQQTVVIENARAVLPDRIVEKASVVIDEGLIASIDDVPTTAGTTLDASDLVCCPVLSTSIFMAL